MNRVQKIRVLTSPQDQKKLMLMLVPMILTALVSVVGIAAVIPFIAIAADPKSVFQHKKLHHLYSILHFQSVPHFVIFLGFLAFIMLVVTNALAALTSWLSNRISAKIRARITQALYVKYLHMPYEFHLDHNSATLMSNMFTLTSQFTNGYIIVGLQLISNTILVFFIVTLIVLVNPEVALLTSVLFGGGYLTIYLTLKKVLNSKSIILARSGEAILKLVSESLGGIKDIKLKNHEDVFTQQSMPLLYEQADCTSMTQLMTTMPKYVIEAVAFGGIILITTLLVGVGHRTASVIPTLGLYAYAGYRILPALTDTIFRVWLL